MKTLQESLKHFNTQQKRYVREHNGKPCPHYDNILKLLNEAINKEEKVGEWVSEIGDCHSTGKYRVCAKCGGNVFIPYFSKQGIERKDFNYCPNCGCKMKENNGD